MKANEAQEQYIKKSALAAEIENLKNTYKKCPTNNLYEDGLKEGRLIGYKDVLHKINTLEVKEVKEPTASDRGMAEEIIINLKRVEQDYHIDLTKEMEWLRNLMKKGE